jgi:cytochrome P450
MVDGEFLESSTLLDVLLTSTIDGRPMTNVEIREEVDTFTFAGNKEIN